MKKYIIIFLAFFVSTYAHADTSYYYKKAQKLVGLHEVSDRRELRELLSVDPVRTPWCGYFMYYIYENTIQLDNPGLARNWLKVGQKTNNPRKGDLAIFSRSTSDWEGHVGFYVDEYKINGVYYIVVLGGNQKDSVRYSLYRKSRLLGYRRINT